MNQDNFDFIRENSILTVKIKLEDTLKGSKKCLECGLEGNINLFVKNENKCKECHRKKYYKTKEKYEERRKNYRTNHKEERKEYWNNYYKENKELILEKGKKRKTKEANKTYYEKIKEKQKEYKRNYFNNVGRK